MTQTHLHGELGVSLELQDVLLRVRELPGGAAELLFEGGGLEALDGEALGELQQAALLAARKLLLELGHLALHVRLVRLAHRVERGQRGLRLLGQRLLLVLAQHVELVSVRGARLAQRASVPVLHGRQGALAQRLQLLHGLLLLAALALRQGAPVR